MKHLVFPHNDGASIRRAALEERSLLPVSAACLAANGIRERLTTLCGAPVELRLLPPSLPQGTAWEAILRDARLYPVHGTLCDAAIVLRPYDAEALSALLFGELRSERSGRALSPLESEVARRAAGALSAALVVVCGETKENTQTNCTGFATYFELQLIEPVELRIGVALSREPDMLAAPSLRLDELHDVTFDGSVEVGLGQRSAHEVAALTAGDTLTSCESAGSLRVNGRAVARGACGVRGARYAIAVERSL